MIQPVILYDDAFSAETKQWVITIHKSLVHEDVDRLTYKHVEASAAQDPRQRNAISSDVSEHLDGSVVERYVEFRHAQLCKLLQAALVAEESTGTDDEPLDANDKAPSQEPSLIYWLAVPKETPDALRRPLAEYIHRFLVWGVLYDWYSQFGMQQAAVYGSELSRLEDEIDSIVRGPSIVKRPMQPYGPAQKIY